MQDHAQDQLGSETDGIAPLDTAALVEQAQALGYANQCELLRADVPWRPLRSSAPRFTGTQSAWVVGPSGSPSDTSAGDVYGDKLDRVRIRFQWQGQLADGDGTISGTASCWVRVAQRSAVRRDASARAVKVAPRIDRPMAWLFPFVVTVMCYWFST